MGRPKSRIGRLHKNYEKKRQALKKNPTGRPRKFRAKKVVGIVIVLHVVVTGVNIPIFLLTFNFFH